MKTKNNLRRGLPNFSHFMSLPFIQPGNRQSIKTLQENIQEIFNQYERKQCLRVHSHLLCHITLFMLTIKRQQIRQKCAVILKQKQKEILELIQGLQIKLSQVKYFTRYHKNLKCDEITVIYFDIKNQEAIQKLQQVTDILIRQMMKQQVIVHEQLVDMHIYYDHKTGKFKPEKFHMSLFRANNLMVDEKTIAIFEQINKSIEEPFTFTCKLLDISTMKEYNQEQFYLPLARLKLAANNKAEQS